ncbi:hypothetical protein L249_3905 [Ophiocordyceps polyrhachis-furcata BCC 54312]|uniref:SET domain-containing protein n=1 Tax=Ophiocordyceps polyrhachis-furcata BCC 54312 TaxID=1330021 RepID=A0A367L566_9HYPO|nr:hypothetical protein L249_3905 [Ophiocordyceps polyrhachis-furcata BCC 54312]
MPEPNNIDAVPIMEEKVVVEWATSRGVFIDGIAPRPLSHRGGFGIVATQPIKTSQTVLKVPTVLFRTLDNTPAWISARLQGATVHAILAAWLCLEAVDDVWRAVLPPREDVVASMPLCWCDRLSRLLPSSTEALVRVQRRKFDHDWARVSKAFNDGVEKKGMVVKKEISRADFLYAWILVNSRTFYHTTANTETRLAKEDHMALVPVADLFNHSPDEEQSCSVTFDTQGYTFVASRSYAPGEEVLICYGKHSNDTLLVEYGFTLGEGGAEGPNPYEETCLDAYLCPLLSPAQSLRLEESGFWKRYMLDAETPCYRTVTALRICCLPSHHWPDVLDGSRDEDWDRPVVDARLRPLLIKYETDIRRRLILIDDLDGEVHAQQKASLRSRCIAAQNILLANIARIQS